MGVSTRTKQIRVSVEATAHKKLKDTAKALGLKLQHYSGLVLSGYKIVKTE